MDRKHFKYRILLIGVLFFLISRNVNAGTNIRGQVQYFNQYYQQYFPLVNAIVDLYYSPSPNQFVFVRQTITNNAGFYFFYGIQPSNTVFFIQINRAKNYQISVIPIQYYNNQYNYNQFLDIPILYF